MNISERLEQVSTQVETEDNQSQSPSKEDTHQGEDLQTSGRETPTGKETTEEAQAILDLAKAGKFRLDGQEMTLEDLRKSMMRQQDYTRKTQSLSEERKYYDNLEADLEKIKRDPRLAQEFRQVYPEKFHRFLSFLGVREAAQEESQNSLPPEFIERLTRLEQGFTQREQEAFSAKLDVIEGTLLKKYPRANVTDVYGAADSFFKENNIKPNQVDERMLEQFFKGSHEYNLAQYKEWQKEEMNKQREATNRASDTGRGGGTPGEAPKKIKFRDVADAMLAQE